MLYGSCLTIDEVGRVVDSTYVHDWDLKYAVEECDHCIAQPASFIRRRVLDEVGYLDERLDGKHDHELWLRIGRAGTIMRTPDLFACERSTPSYLSSRGDDVARACVSLTKKFYSAPESRTLVPRTRLSMSSAYLRGLDYAWKLGRKWRIILPYSAMVAFYRPSRTWLVARRLRWMIAAEIRRLRAAPKGENRRG